jgi:outer membrane lipoprotein
MYIKVSMLLVAFWLGGCSTIPENLQVTDGTNLVSYQDAASKAEQVKGQTARWGGVIAKVENKADSTMLEMVYYPLRSYGRPISGDESMGRFRVYVNGFMDPMIYQKGRSMTFTGELTGLEDGLVGEHKYVFPSMSSSAYHLWKNVQNVDVTRIHVWPYDYWHGWYPRPYHRRLIIRGSSSSHSGKASSSGSTKPKPISRPQAQER